MLIISYDCMKSKEKKEIHIVFRKYETGKTHLRQERKADGHLSGKTENRTISKGKKRKFRREKEGTGRKNLGDRLAISH